MRVGDLVIMPGSIEPATGIILRMKSDGEKHGLGRVEVYWIEDAEAAWEPKKWLEVISENRGFGKSSYEVGAANGWYCYRC